MRDLKPITRDDTEHGVEYVKLADVVAEREADRALMREALVSFNRMLDVYDAMDNPRGPSRIVAEDAISKLRARVG